VAKLRPELGKVKAAVKLVPKGSIVTVPEVVKSLALVSNPILSAEMTKLLLLEAKEPLPNLVVPDI
jgi:hypothetical protein